MHYTQQCLLRHRTSTVAFLTNYCCCSLNSERPEQQSSLNASVVYHPGSALINMQAWAAASTLYLVGILRWICWVCHPGGLAVALHSCSSQLSNCNCNCMCGWHASEVILRDTDRCCGRVSCSTAWVLYPTNAMQYIQQSNKDHRLAYEKAPKGWYSMCTKPV
jgi:hypothetical protein